MFMNGEIGSGRIVSIIVGKLRSMPIPRPGPQVPHAVGADKTARQSYGSYEQALGLLLIETRSYDLGGSRTV